VPSVAYNTYSIDFYSLYFTNYKYHVEIEFEDSGSYINETVEIEESRPVVGQTIGDVSEDQKTDDDQIELDGSSDEYCSSDELEDLHQTNFEIVVEPISSNEAYRLIDTMIRCSGIGQRNTKNPKLLLKVSFL